MQIPTQQIINPGILDVSDKHKKQLARYKEAVKRAQFLNEGERHHWTLLGYILTTAQLLDAERMIISEDMRLLQTKQELEKLKPNI